MPMQNFAATAAVETAPEIIATYGVTVKWQPEGCYTAVSDDIIGLVLEADSLEEMKECMLETVPDLLELGHGFDESSARKISVRQIGAISPRGLTRYEIVQLA